MDQENVVSWRETVRPPVVAAVLSPLLLLADLALIAVFILRQNWNAVILLSVVFFCGTQAIYWYFRTKSILTNRQQVPQVTEVLRLAPPVLQLYCIRSDLFCSTSS
nr:uncharacterized protein LOC128691615 [Cherax quadricarinatus]